MLPRPVGFGMEMLNPVSMGRIRLNCTLAVGAQAVLVGQGLGTTILVSQVAMMRCIVFH